ncbi:MAG: glycosyltransferase family 87 protein [Terriglobales bacterium]
MEQLEWLAFGVLALAAALLALLRPEKAIDFHVYFENARHYFAGAPMYGPQSGMAWPGGVYRYPPIFLDLFRPLALLPLRLAVVLWAVGKIAAGGAVVIALRKRWGLHDAGALWPGLLLIAAYFIQELRYGNAQFFIVVMVVAAFLAERPLWRGFWLGWAAALKIWPLFFLPCLLVRKKWKASGWMLAWAAGWTLLPVLWRGVGAQMALLRAWLTQERSIAALSAAAGELWYPGQSLHDVLARYLRVIDYRRLADASAYHQIAWLQMAPATVEHLWMLLAALLTLAMLYWLARMRGPADGAVALMLAMVMVLEPHVHRLVMVTLLWPALWLSAEWAHGRLRGKAQTWLWVAVAASVLEPLVPGAARQRVLQTYGSDFFLVIVPLAVLTAWWGWRGHIPPV